MKSITQNIPLSAIEERENIRKTYDPVQLKQLSDSIVLKGQLQAIGVRPKMVDGKVVTGKYVVVFGHRRFRAHKLAKLTEIRAEVIDVADDAEVTVLQDIENGQRVNLDILDRAAGHQKMKADGKSLEEIATSTTTSEATVRDSLKLSELVPDVLTAFRDGKISFSHAVQIAKVPPTLQPELLKWSMKPLDQWRKEWPSVRELKQKVDNEYILDLKKAQFDPKDALLVPAAGACTTCVKRTGAQSQLFEGYKADLCLDRPCNDVKTDAALAKMGAKVLPADEARDTFWDNGNTKRDGDYVLAAAENESDPKRRPFAELVGEEVAKKLEVVAVDPTGKVVKLFNKKAAEAAVKKAGLVSEAKKEAELKSKQREQKRKAKAANVDTKEIERKEDFEESIKKALAGAIVAAFEKEGASAKALRFLLERLVSVFYCTELYERRGLKVGVGREALEKAFAKHFGAAKPDVLTGVFFEALFTDDNTDDEERDLLLVDAAQLLRVNLTKIEIDLREADAAARAKVAESKSLTQHAKKPAGKKGKAA